MKPICVKCKCFYTAKKNGFVFTEGMPVGDPEMHWGPYKLWVGDLWECRKCGHEIIVGVGSRQIAEHYEPDFTEKNALSELPVEDC